MGEPSTWCIPTPEKREVVYCYQSLTSDDLNSSNVSSSKVSLRRNKSMRRGKDSVDDLHKKIELLNRRLNSMKTELASELVRKVRDHDDMDFGEVDGRSIVISRQYGDDQRDTKMTLATKATRIQSRHWGAASIIERYDLS